MSIRYIEVQYIGDTFYLPPYMEREVNHIIVRNLKNWEHFEPKLACHMTPSDYHPCAEDDCMRLKVRMWTCSECEADYVGSKPKYCPNCGAKVVSE